MYEHTPSMVDRLEHMMAVVAATIANANRDPKKRKEPFKPDDFIPKREFITVESPGRSQETQPRQSVEQMVSMAEMLHSYFSSRPPGPSEGE